MRRLAARSRFISRMSCSACCSRSSTSIAEHEEAFARRGQHQPLPDAQEQGRAEAGFDVAQLVAERRLGQVQLIAGAGQAADFGHGGDEPQVADLQIHVHEPTSST